MEETMVKFVVGIIIGVLALIFVVMNSELIDLRLYFWTITISRSIMLIIVLGAGIGIGYILNGLRIRKSRK